MARFSSMLALALLWALAFQAQALQMVDDRGVTVTLARPPQRIVSLLPSLTETVCALGQCQRLVGVDRYSNHPAAVRALPQVGGGIDPNIEAVVALKPDLVLMAMSARGAQRLESLGLKVVVLEPRTSADVRRAIAGIGRLLAVPDADGLWRTIDAGVAAAVRSLPAQARDTRFYFEVSRGPYAAGQTSFVGEIMLRMGVHNIIAAELGPYPRINPEYVVRADPDLVMIGRRSALGLDQRPGWPHIRALREKRLCIFSEEEADVLVRAGPRMAEAARIVARCIAEHGGAGRR